MLWMTFYSNPLMRSLVCFSSPGKLMKSLLSNLAFLGPFCVRVLWGSHWIGAMSSQAKIFKGICTDFWAQPSVTPFVADGHPWFTGSWAVLKVSLWLAKPGERAIFPPGYLCCRTGSALRWPVRYMPTSRLFFSLFTWGCWHLAFFCLVALLQKYIFCKILIVIGRKMSPIQAIFLSP